MLTKEAPYPMKLNKCRLSAAAAAVVLLLCAMLLAGCSQSDKHPQFLTEHTWTHFAVCDETISFGEDGSYAYHCACGEPVGDSDLYEEYSYDESKSEIRLKPDGEDSTIKVLRHEKSRLLLDFGDGVKEFFDMNDSVTADSAPKDLGYDTDGVTAGFSSYLAIVQQDGSTVVTAPASYDGDDSGFEEYLLTEELAADVEYYDWNLRITEGSQGIEPESSFRKLTANEAADVIESGSAAGFVWYDGTGQITRIVFYGSTIYYE